MLRAALSVRHRKAPEGHQRWSDTVERFVYMKRDFEVKILLINENGLWVAQCLDYDFAAQGKNMKEAMDSFARSFAGQICTELKYGKEPFEDFTKAPIEYWDMFDASEPLRTAHFPVPEAFVPDGIGFAHRAVYA